MAIVMEYCNHGNLKDILMSLDVDLSVPHTLKLCTDIASGLTSVHNFNKQKHLVHCDVKPGNILVTKDFRCKIADFGGAKLCDFTNTLSLASNPTRDQFTVAYTAPEVLKNPGMPINKEQDTYAFGMVIHMLLTRKYPFTTVPEVFVEAVKSGSRPNIEKIRKLKKNLKGRDLESVQLLEDIMTKCWQQNPKKRPRMLDVRDRLEAQLAKYKLSVVACDVANAMKCLDVKDPVTRNDGSVPLYTFLPESGSFVANRKRNKQSPSVCGMYNNSSFTFHVKNF